MEGRLRLSVDSGWCIAVRASLFLGVVVSACAAPIFPEEVRQKVDAALSFNDLTKNPDFYKDRTVALGGRILRSLSEEGEVSMLVRALPIRTEPVYGPLTSVVRLDCSSFALLGQ